MVPPYRGGPPTPNGDDIPPRAVSKYLLLVSVATVVAVVVLLFVLSYAMTYF
jgi:hypothetical protein